MTLLMITRADERYVRASGRAAPRQPRESGNSRKARPSGGFAERNTLGTREHISSTSFKMRAYTSPSLFCTPSARATFAAVP